MWPVTLLRFYLVTKVAFGRARPIWTAACIHAPPATAHGAFLMFFSSTLSYKFAKADIGGVWAYRIIFDLPNCSPARASKLVDAGEGSIPAFCSPSDPPFITVATHFSSKGSLRLQFDANIKGK